ncbi:neutral zinc metallopeptidase [Congregibacter sp.]|uniref:neutral zinc metallopeptidase n=1 Tax=Congregibacter sp. TaxID=2744308 RepID=UPI003F6BF9D3
MGPFYCPGDQKIYLDLSFFEQLSQRYGAPGDFAQAYVLAHEVGHHVQTLLGISARNQAARQILESGDIEEALAAAIAIGDDTLQRQAQGRVTPDSFTQGSAEQRLRWFTVGLEKGSLESCNTFAATSLR